MLHHTKRTMVYFFLCILFTITCSAFLSDKTMAAEKQRISDTAGILTSEELSKLETLSGKYSEKRGIDLYISVIDSVDVTDIDQYSEDFLTEHPGKTIVLAMNMATRKVAVYASKDAKQNFNTDRCTMVREKITPALTKGNYYDAFETYLQKTYQYLVINANFNPESIFLKIWFQALIALIIAAAAVITMAYNSGGKITVSQNTYLDPAHSGIVHKHDNYIRTVTTRTRKPESSSGGHGGSGGGGSHSSGSAGSSGSF